MIVFLCDSKQKSRKSRLFLMVGSSLFEGVSTDGFSSFVRRRDSCQASPQSRCDRTLRYNRRGESYILRVLCGVLGIPRSRVYAGTLPLEFAHVGHHLLLARTVPRNARSFSIRRAMHRELSGTHTVQNHPSPHRIVAMHARWLRVRTDEIAHAPYKYAVCACARKSSAPTSLTSLQTSSHTRFSQSTMLVFPWVHLAY